MKTKRGVTLVLVLLASLLLVAAALAAPMATTVDRYVIGGGGGRAETALYVLEGTIGQPVVGGLRSDPYDLGAGFWGGIGAVAGAHYQIYLPLAVRGYSP